MYVSTGVFADRIREAGAEFRPYRDAFLADLRELPDRTDTLVWLLTRTTGEILGAQLDGFRAERPDYVIADSVAPWGQWIAQALNLLGAQWQSDQRFDECAAFQITDEYRDRRLAFITNP